MTVCAFKRTDFGIEGAMIASMGASFSHSNRKARMTTCTVIAGTRRMAWRYDRCPATCCFMTTIAIIVGSPMVLRFTGCRFTIVTQLTVIATVLMIPGTANESRGGMTQATIQVGRQVTLILTFRRIAIMTGSTIVCDAGMIKGCRNESRGIMAKTTIPVGRNMII